MHLEPVQQLALVQQNRGRAPTHAPTLYRETPKTVIIQQMFLQPGRHGVLVLQLVQERDQDPVIICAPMLGMMPQKHARNLVHKYFTKSKI